MELFLTALDRMDALNMVVQVPAWAYDFCFYYLAVAAVVVVYSLYSLVQLFMLPALVKKVVPVTSIAIALVLSGAVTALLTMMQFWVCRSALAPHTAEKFASHNMGVRSGVKEQFASNNMRGVLGGPVGVEQFAVTCKKPEDCVAVAGTQRPGSLCTCGDRGFCAGCTMNSDMEPSMMPEYDMPLAGLKEGFAGLLSGAKPRMRKV